MCDLCTYIMIKSYIISLHNLCNLYRTSLNTRCIIQVLKKTHMAKADSYKSRSKSYITVLFRKCWESQRCLLPYHNQITYVATACNSCFIGCPRIIRADHGTENCAVAKVHIGLRMNHSDDLAGSKSFIYGPSTANTVRYIDALCWISLC